MFNHEQHYWKHITAPQLIISTGPALLRSSRVNGPLHSPVPVLMTLQKSPLELELFRKYNKSYDKTVVIFNFNTKEDVRREIVKALKKKASTAVFANRRIPEIILMMARL